MKKIVILIIAMGFFVTSCLPAPATDLPVPTVDINGTAAVFVQQTLQAMPSITMAPTNTPVVVAVVSSETPTIQIETSTPDQTLVTSTTGTLVTPTLISTGTTTQSATTGTATIPITFTPNVGSTATQTLHPRFYGTLPPDVPYNGIELVNKSKAEAYISLQVTIEGGYTTILEYPVGKAIVIQAPIGRYKYVAWVGGNKILGSFVLNRSNDVRITIYKDRIEVKAR